MYSRYASAQELQIDLQKIIDQIGRPAARIEIAGLVGSVEEAVETGELEVREESVSNTGADDISLDGSNDTAALSPRRGESA